MTKTRNMSFGAAAGLSLLALVAVVVMAFCWYPPLAGTAQVSGAPFAVLRADDKVNVNEDGLLQLSLLPGIGEKKAQAIIDYREQHGAFKAAEELQNVSGIGPKIMEDLINLICV